MEGVNKDMKYYEIEIGNTPDDCNNYWMCIKGVRKPTIEEANIFIASDCARYNGTVQGVFEISFDYAKDCYDFSREEIWPVFGEEI